MTSAEALTAYATRLQAGFLSLPLIASGGDNVDEKDIPDGGGVKLTLRPGREVPVATGLLMGPVMIVATVFVPAQIGNLTALEYAEAINALFKPPSSIDLAPPPGGSGYLSATGWAVDVVGRASGRRPFYVTQGSTMFQNRNGY